MLRSGGVGLTRILWLGPLGGVTVGLAVVMGLVLGSAEAFVDGIPLPAEEGTRWEIAGG